MKQILSKWEGSIEIDGVEYENYAAIDKRLDFSKCSYILLKSNKKPAAGQIAAASAQEYVITVRQYMLKKATPSFDFMLKWNNDEPMPFRTMVGTIEKETPGMYKMNLHADIIADKLDTCMCCGKPITNEVSKYFGMGPICGNHNYVNPFETEAELHAAVEAYKKRLQSVTWSGWVIKSAITAMEEFNHEIES